MRRILAYLLFFVFMIIGLPFCVSIFWTREETAQRKNITAMVKMADGSVREVDVEEYLYGVLAGEMPASFHKEALKAQAVAARTYIVNKKQNGETDDVHPDADICTDSTHCKAWLSEEEIQSRMGADWEKTYGKKMHSAISETAGEIMVYDNEPIVAVFHSTGSGKTENSEDVWGGNLPYLRSVESPGDMTSPKFESEVTVTKSAFESTLGVTADIGEVTHSQGGAVKSIVIGGKKWSGGEIRSLFGLNSSNFEIQQTDGEFVFHVKGNGHGVGMSQYGANAMAEEGASYDQILKTYYTGVEIAVE
ncbi:MAG: stage II sporulation protein D [Clostridia bacterium]|nr:stage II sporulation protein D [Clostridia bacterium]